MSFDRATRRPLGRRRRVGALGADPPRRAGANYGWSVVEGPQPVRPDGRRARRRSCRPSSSTRTPRPHRSPAAMSIAATGSRRLAASMSMATTSRARSGACGTTAARSPGGASWPIRACDSSRSARDATASSTSSSTSGRTRSIALSRTPVLETGRRSRAALGQTGLFTSTRDQVPAPGVIPYAINAELWCDGTKAERLMAIPGDGRSRSTRGDAGDSRTAPCWPGRSRSISWKATPARRRRLETQVLHREDGSWRPYTYIWDDSQADATLADAAGASRLVHRPRPRGSRRLARARLSLRRAIGMRAAATTRGSNPVTSSTAASPPRPWR